LLKDTFNVAPALDVLLAERQERACQRHTREHHSTSKREEKSTARTEAGAHAGRDDQVLARHQMATIGNVDPGLSPDEVLLLAGVD
jgi:hypothetical protein